MQQTVDAKANMTNEFQHADSAQALAFGTFIFNVRLCRFARSTIPGNSV